VDGEGRCPLPLSMDRLTRWPSHDWLVDHEFFNSMADI
jgi:hypothetical protein